MPLEQQDQQPKLKLFGTVGSPAAYAIRDFLHRSDVPFEWVEIHNNQEAREIGVDQVHDPRLPVCVFADGTRMERPTVRQIIEKLGWFRTPSPYTAIFRAAKRPYTLSPNSVSGCGKRSPSRATHTYRVGSKKMLRSRAPMRPPTITMAKGRCESEPMPRDSAAGSKPKVATNMVIIMGRNRRTAPSIAADSIV
jgi:hypothetical protein